MSPHEVINALGSSFIVDPCISNLKSQKTPGYKFNPYLHRSSIHQMTLPNVLAYVYTVTFLLNGTSNALCEGKNLIFLRVQLDASQSKEDGVMEKTHCGYDFNGF